MEEKLNNESQKDNNAERLTNFKSAWIYYLNTHPAFILTILSLIFLVIAYQYSLGYFSKLGISMPSDKSSSYFILLEKATDFNFKEVVTFFSWKKFGLVFFFVLVFILLTLEKVNNFVTDFLSIKTKNNSSGKCWFPLRGSIIVLGIVLISSVVVFFFFALISAYQTALVLFLILFMLGFWFPTLSSASKDPKTFFKSIYFIVFGVMFLTTSKLAYEAGILDAKKAIKDNFSGSPTICWSKKNEDKKFHACQKLIFSSSDYFYVTDAREYKAVLLLQKGDFYYTIKPSN